MAVSVELYPVRLSGEGDCQREGCLRDAEVGVVSYPYGRTILKWCIPCLMEGR